MAPISIFNSRLFNKLIFIGIHYSIVSNYHFKICVPFIRIYIYATIQALTRINGDL